MIADRHLWLDVARTKICEEGAAEADFLLAPRGIDLSAEQVAQYHLVVDADGHVQQEPAPEPPAPEEG
jgi:hypothetical protein